MINRLLKSSLRSQSLSKSQRPRKFTEACTCPAASLASASWAYILTNAGGGNERVVPPGACLALKFWCRDLS